MRSGFVKFYSAKTVFLQIKWIFVALFCPAIAFAQTADKQNYLIKKNELDTGSGFLVEATRKQILQWKQSNSLTFFRKIDKERYVILSSDLPAKEKVVTQSISNYKWKLPGTFEEKMVFPAHFVIQLVSVEVMGKFLSRHDLINTARNSKGSYVMTSIQSGSALESILADPEVVFIKQYYAANDESPNSRQDLSVNKVNRLHHEYSALNGEGFNVSVKERTVDTTDIDLKNRFIRTALADSITSLHANQIATLIAGGGNSQMNSKGVAWGSKILSSSYNDVMPDDQSILTARNAWVQNHSYGTTIEPYYGPEAAAYDEAAVAHSTSLNVFSAGNSGSATVTSGQYASIPGYANLTGNMKMAKNVLVVGGHQQFFELDERNSNGPAHDGRVKPEIVAYGPEGTSDAAAIVSGTVSLLQEKYFLQNGELPRLDLVKAVLIATADDIGSPGIDHKTGFGALNAYNAVRAIDNSNYFVGEVESGQTQQFELNIPDQIKNIRICLNWIDPPVAAGSSEALLNDLDVSLITPGAQVILPWVLRTNPVVDSLEFPAHRKEDHLNNVEYITLSNPVAGNYKVVVKANELLGTQAFSIAYVLEEEQYFQFTFPTSSDRVRLDELVVRWQSGYEGTGSLHASLDDGQSYFPIANVDLETGYYALVPEFAGKVILKMEIGNESFVSESFTVSEEPRIEVEFVCDNKSMVSWDKVEQASTYNIYTMGDKYLQLVSTVTDTVTTFNRDEVGSFYFAVEPVINGQSGYRSVTYDVAQQGVRCYYKDLLADAYEGEAILTLNLSTTYNVERVLWLKKIDAQFQKIGETSVSTLAPTFTDIDPISGVSFYQAVIVLKTGETVTTDEVVLYFADEASYFLFPNPVSALEEDLNVLTDGDELAIYFFDTSGRLVKTQEILSPLFNFSLSDLPPGLYLYRIKRRVNWVNSGRLVLK